MKHGRGPYHKLSRSESTRFHCVNRIRELYTPLQPTVKQSSEGVHYAEVLPDPLVQPYIFCYWELKTCQPLASPFHYTVVPDGCCDIFFLVDNPHESFVMGSTRRFTEFSLATHFHYAGIRFLPTIFPQLFNISARELANQSFALSDVLPQTASFISNHTNEHSTIEQLKTLFDQYFIQQLSGANFDADIRLYQAVNVILQKAGNLNVESGLDTGISSRQLRRLFDFYIGNGMKTFSQVVRFQHILLRKLSGDNHRDEKIYFDAGYYDQAHFIREFRNFYGMTPAQAFAS